MHGGHTARPCVSVAEHREEKIGSEDQLDFDVY